MQEIIGISLVVLQIPSFSLLISADFPTNEPMIDEKIKTSFPFHQHSIDIIPYSQIKKHFKLTLQLEVLFLPF